VSGNAIGQNPTDFRLPKFCKYSNSVLSTGRRMVDLALVLLEMTFKSVFLSI